MSDSSYARRRFHFGSHMNFARPANIDLVDDEWAMDALSDDDIDFLNYSSTLAPSTHETILNFQREEEVLEGDAYGSGTMFAISGSSALLSGNPNRSEDDKWLDLGLDSLQAQIASQTESSKDVHNIDGRDGDGQDASGGETQQDDNNVEEEQQQELQRGDEEDGGGES
mmetsp:Transcript_10133/g.13184  ORF Transcript_10133/g.13184 Transcript_10133/m.13184 type:complete len:169 (-) Transcript_10133:302-808(-)